MSPKWFIGFAMLFVLLTISNGIIEQTYFGTSEAGVLWQAMTSFSAIEFTNPLTATYGIIIGLWSLIQALFKMFLFDYAFLTGVWVIFRYLFCCISLGVIVSFILAIRGTASG